MICSKCGTNNNQDSSFCSKCGTQLEAATGVAINDDIPSPQPVKYAGFWIRLLATIIDIVLIATVCFALAFCIALIYVFVSTPDGTPAEDSSSYVKPVFDCLFFLIVPWLWFTISESSIRQATVGKQLFGLKVMNENGARIGFGRANVRFFSKYLISTWLFIGFLIAGITAKKQGLHDFLARTLVTKSNT